VGQEKNTASPSRPAPDGLLVCVVSTIDKPCYQWLGGGGCGGGAYLAALQREAAEPDVASCSLAPTGLV